MKKTIEERVQLGLQYIDQTFEDWIEVFREEDLDINIYSSNLHVLARVSGWDFNMSYRDKFDTGEEQWLYDRGFYPITSDETEDLNEEWKLRVEQRKLTKLFSIPNTDGLPSPTIQGDLFNEETPANS